MELPTLLVGFISVRKEAPVLYFTDAGGQQCTLIDSEVISVMVVGILLPE